MPIAEGFSGARDGISGTTPPPRQGQCLGHRDLFGPVKNKSGWTMMLPVWGAACGPVPDPGSIRWAGRARLWLHGCRVPGDPASDPLATRTWAQGLTPSELLGSQGEEASWATGSPCTLQAPRLTGFGLLCSNLHVPASSSGIHALMLS